MDKSEKAASETASENEDTKTSSSKLSNGPSVVDKSEKAASQTASANEEPKASNSSSKISKEPKMSECKIDSDCSTNK